MVYLGTITALNGSSINNVNQASNSFLIAGFWPRLLFVTPVASGVTFRTTLGSYNSNAISSPTFAATASDYGIAEQTAAQLSTPNPPGLNTVAAIYGDGGGGIVTIYGLFGPAQS